LPKPLFICVDGILIKEEKILLLKRNVEPFRGFWHVIGGHVEENETLAAALTREFKEETDLDVCIGEVLGGRIEETFDRIKLIVVFKVYNPVGKVKLNEESQEYCWFDHVPTESVYDYSKFLAKPEEMSMI
jgi:8-oxo-dGTP diphosphatase